MGSPLSGTTRLYVATRNRHKLQEITAILGPTAQCRGLDDFPEAPPTVEDQLTFAGNAQKKARELADWLSRRKTDLPPARRQFVLADDSGLEVDALNGAPGVHSARFAAAEGEGNSSDAANNEKLLRLLKDVPGQKRIARFRCVLALAPIGDSDSASETLFEGACEGRIDFAARGGRGFGYDPLFIPDGFDQSFAQLGDEIKNRISHRARALERLRSWLDSPT